MFYAFIFISSKLSMFLYNCKWTERERPSVPWDNGMNAKHTDLLVQIFIHIREAH